MNKRDLEVYVENYINNRPNKFIIKWNKEDSPLDAFYLKTIKRLLVANSLFRNQHHFFEDFMLALRDYLLVFETSVQLDNISIPEDNTYGLKRNGETNKYFASLLLPQYVNAEFVERAFMREFKENKVEETNYVLLADPLIYKVTGFKRFKSLAQKLAVYGALNTPDGFTTLVSLPTGGGKSLITQTISYQKNGLTVIVVPTISLAFDQERVAKQLVKSETANEEIFSYSSGADIVPIINAIKNQTAKMLFISPEALINNQGFANAIGEANKKRYLKNIIIDEAHIVLDWGASFRVDYQCLEAWRKKQLLTNPAIRTILLSATFEERSIDLLKSFFSQDGKWIEIRCDSLRHEPRFIVVKSRSYSEKNQRIVELVEKLPHPMIIYVARPADAEALKKVLSDRGIQNIKTFTGLTNNSNRRKLIDDWIDDQYEIMIATSAFGVGVDKGDVRSVIHTYIPENANAYYQELGRSGRDGLPCLSIMCLYPEDSNIGRDRIKKRVLTTEKIIGRWDSMYNNKNSIRQDNIVYMDTSIKPNYASDPFDDSPTSDTDMNWNIYVLLFLRRYYFIDIVDVLPQEEKYIFLIEVKEDRLRSIDIDLTELINHVREKEWTFYRESYERLQKTIKNSEKECISEMFYNTYSKISEFCAGCNAHNYPVVGDAGQFPLKAPISLIGKQLSADQRALFRDSNELIIFEDVQNEDNLYKGLIQKRVSCMLVPQKKEGLIWQHIQERETQANILITGYDEAFRLIKNQGFYYVEGILAIFYPDEVDEIYDKFRLINRYLRNRNGIKIMHIVKENVYFSNLEKTITELIDGPVTTIEALLS